MEWRLKIHWNINDFLLTLITFYSIIKAPRVDVERHQKRNGLLCRLSIPFLKQEVPRVEKIFVQIFQKCDKDRFWTWFYITLAYLFRITQSNVKITTSSTSASICILFLSQNENIFSIWNLPPTIHIRNLGAKILNYFTICENNLLMVGMTT